MAHYWLEEKFTPTPGTTCVLMKPEGGSMEKMEADVKYTPDVGSHQPNNGSSINKLLKYLALAWILAAAFLIVHQSLYRDMVVVEPRPDTNVISRIYYYILLNSHSDVQSPPPEIDPTPICTPGEFYKPDSCNTCQCDADGNPTICTKMACPEDNDNFIVAL